MIGSTEAIKKNFGKSSLVRLTESRQRFTGNETPNKMKIATLILTPIVSVLLLVAVCYWIAPTTTKAALQGIKHLGGFGDRVVNEVVR